MDSNYVISFNPAVPGDLFLWDRGFLDKSLLDKIKKADAVIFHQTVSPELYHLARSLCPRVFPNYDVRFRWQGKIGDTLLFWRQGVKHPATWIFPRVEALLGTHAEMEYKPPQIYFPCVIKANSGGEGSSIYLIENEEHLDRALKLLRRMEWQGRCGFVVQEYIAGIERDLRVVVIGDYVTSYWRNSVNFHKNVAKGATIDRDSDQELQARGRCAVKELCSRTGINLAGFDLVFPPGETEPVFIEINYTFGRRGLGGTERFYDILNEQVNNFLGR